MKRTPVYLSPLVALLASIFPIVLTASPAAAAAPTFVVDPEWVADTEPYQVTRTARASGLVPNSIVYIQQCENQIYEGDTTIGVNCEFLGSVSIDLETSAISYVTPYQYRVDSSGQLSASVDLYQSYNLDGELFYHRGDCTLLTIKFCFLRLVTETGETLVVQDPDTGTRYEVPWAHFGWQCQNYGPVAKLTATYLPEDGQPSDGDAPESVMFDASASYPQSSCETVGIESYTFDFGDGTIVGPQAASSATHTYLEPGEYTATVTVKDTGGLTATKVLVISVGDPDRDGDGVLNADDNCWAVPNADQADADGDGVGNVCDEWPDCAANDDVACEEPLDTDGDGRLDSADNCPAVANPGQEDFDRDGVGAACDDDECTDGKFSSAEWGAGWVGLDDDLFAFHASASWCINRYRSSVSIRNLDSTRLLFPDGVDSGAVALESILGIEFQEKAGSSTPSVLVREDGAKIVTFNTPGFEACVSPMDIVQLFPPLKGAFKAQAWARMSMEARQSLISKATRAIKLPRVLSDYSAVVRRLAEFTLGQHVDQLLKSTDPIEYLDSLTDVCVDTWDPVVSFILYPDGRSGGFMDNDETLIAPVLENSIRQDFETSV